MSVTSRLASFGAGSDCARSNRAIAFATWAGRSPGPAWLAFSNCTSPAITASSNRAKLSSGLSASPTMSRTTFVRFWLARSAYSLSVSASRRYSSSASFNSASELAGTSGCFVFSFTLTKSCASCCFVYATK